MDDEVLGYKDLAAIPRDKAILDIERPDLMIYEPHFTYSLLDHVDRPGSREVRPAVGGAGLSYWGSGGRPGYRAAPKRVSCSDHSSSLAMLGQP